MMYCTSDFQKMLEALINPLEKKIDFLTNELSKKKQSEFMTVKEVAHKLNVQERTVRTKIKEGKIKAFRNGGMYNIPREDFYNSLKEVKSNSYKR